MTVGELKASEHGPKANALIAKGILPDWLAALVTKYGPTVIAILEDALAKGLSVQTLIELIEKYGPDFIKSLPAAKA